eukprot:ctg_5296.g645
MRGQPEAADAATLALARLARKSGNETAAAVHLRLLRSSGSAPIVRAQAQLEQAKVYRARGDRYRATQLLQQVRAACRALGTDDDDAESLTAVAELHSRVWLLRGRWMQEDRAAAPRTIIECYREALTHKPQWEKAHVMLARFYDTLWQDGRAAGEHLAAATDDDHVDAAGYASWALEHYSRSLRYGCTPTAAAGPGHHLDHHHRPAPRPGAGAAAPAAVRLVHRHAAVVVAASGAPVGGGARTAVRAAGRPALGVSDDGAVERAAAGALPRMRCGHRLVRRWWR